MKKLLATLTLIALLAFPVCAQELYQGTAVDETEAPTLNQILGATTSGGFDSLNNTQTWTWNTLTTHNALVLSTTDGTTGNLLSLSETSTGAAGGSALSATLTGSSNTGKAATFANPSATGWDVYATGSAPNYFAGSVGIGTTTPTGVLSISAPSSTANVNVYGIFESGALSATNTSHTQYGAWFNPTFSATTTAAALIGIDSVPQNTSSGTMTAMWALNLAPQNAGTGLVSNMYGLSSALYNTSTGTVTTMTSLYADCLNQNTSGSVTTCYELYLDTPTATGAISHKYGVYQTDTGSNNYFAGSVGVGNSSPATTLDVNGDITMETGTAGAVLCLTSAHALGHCTSGASCLTTCTCTCAAN